MAVNQSQVDHIITAASEDDPEVKLQNLEREVDLIKTSIKRLLIDIRERMNELENPFTLVTTGTSGAPSSPKAADAEEAKKSALEAREAALDSREAMMNSSTVKKESEIAKEIPPAQSGPMISPHQEERRMSGEPRTPALRSQVESLYNEVSTSHALPEQTEGKLRLQKAYKLFKWTRQAVKKVGHDRLEIILESYRAMGFITRESCDEIREISRLMPSSLGEDHEVGPDEFITELYALNRILAPDDTSMDRDMIEVLMEQRQEPPGMKEKSGGETIDLPRISRGREKIPDAERKR